MIEKGLPEREVMRLLEKTRERDYSYDRFFSTMCTQPHPIAVKAHDMFLETNLGDPGLFPGVAELEERVVAMLGAVSYTHLRAHETVLDLVCRLLLEKHNTTKTIDFYALDYC